MIALTGSLHYLVQAGWITATLGGAYLVLEGAVSFLARKLRRHPPGHVGTCRSHVTLISETTSTLYDGQAEGWVK